jgi:hypothetical protein
MVLASTAGRRVRQADELTLDQRPEPGGAGVVAADGADAVEGALGDSQLYDRVSWPVCLGLRCAQLGDLQWNARWTAVPHGEERREENSFDPGACSPVNV